MIIFNCKIWTKDSSWFHRKKSRAVIGCDLWPDVRIQPVSCVKANKLNVDAYFGQYWVSDRIPLYFDYLLLFVGDTQTAADWDASNSARSRTEFYILATLKNTVFSDTLCLLKTFLWMVPSLFTLGAAVYRPQNILTARKQRVETHQSADRKRKHDVMWLGTILRMRLAEWVWLLLKEDSPWYIFNMLLGL